MKKFLLLLLAGLTSLGYAQQWECEESNGNFSQDQDSSCQEEDQKEPPRRALPAPFASPPFPSAEFQGYPLVGVPPDDTVYPLMKAIENTCWGDKLKDNRIRVYGWINVSGNLSNCKDSNSPDSYWLVPNRWELDQFILRAGLELRLTGGRNQEKNGDYRPIAASEAKGEM